jgi:hypothetical protein
MKYRHFIHTILQLKSFIIKSQVKIIREIKKNIFEPNENLTLYFQFFVIKRSVLAF